MKKINKVTGNIWDFHKKGYYVILSMDAVKDKQKAKLEQAIAFNFPPLQRIIDQLEFEIENNLETTSL